MRKSGLLLAMACMVASGVVRAAVTNYTTDTVGTFDWADAPWETNGVSVVPVWDGNRAVLEAGTVNLTPTSNPGPTWNFPLDSIEIKPSAVGATLNISYYIKTTSWLLTGWNNTGTATINHTADQFRAAGGVRLGASGSGSSNIYNLSGTGILKSEGGVNIAEGLNTSATMNINAGGTLDIWSHPLYIGNATGSSGTVNLSDGGTLIYTSGWVIVGRYGTGTINQTGGELRLVGANLVLSDQPDVSGTYTISGGSITNTAGKHVACKGTNSLFVVDGSGATSIEMNRLYVDAGGVFRVNLDAGGSTLVKASEAGAGTIGIAFRPDSTLELDTLAGFDGEVGDVYDLMWTQTNLLGSVTNMTLVNLGTNVNFALSVVVKDGGDMLQATVIAGYETWAAGWGGVDIGSTTNDYDNDGLSNLYEYGLDGDPTNEFDQGTSPTFEVVEVGGSNVFSYVYPQRSDPNSGLTYYLELNTDLIAGTWVNSGYTVSGINDTGETLNFVTNTTDTVGDQKFIRLIIE